MSGELTYGAQSEHGVDLMPYQVCAPQAVVPLAKDVMILIQQFLDAFLVAWGVKSSPGLLIQILHMLWHSGAKWGPSSVSCMWILITDPDTVRVHTKESSSVSTQL